MPSAPEDAPRAPRPVQPTTVSSLLAQGRAEDRRNQRKLDPSGYRSRQVSPVGADLSAGATGNATGNTSILLDHTEDDYSPWSVVDSGLALAAPKIALFDLKVTVTVHFTLIPEHEYGAPWFWFHLPWGFGDKAGTYFYSSPVFLFNDTSGSASFSGSVLRGPDDDALWHTIEVTMRNINPYPPSTDPEGPPVADGVTWEASASFQYIDQLVTP